MKKGFVGVVKGAIKVGRVLGRGLESERWRCRLCRVSLSDGLGAWLSRL